jgi:hypothetical protein
MATSLTPSQLTGSTVVRPETPPPCDPGEVALWTARADIVDTLATGIVRVRNDGPVWCEVDLSGSPKLDRAAEPDLWLEPGAWGELWIGESDKTRCDVPQAVRLAQVRVGGTDQVIATAAVVSCDWAVTALYGLETPDAACEPSAIEVARVLDELVVRNGGPVACILGRLGDVDGGATMSVQPQGPAVESLAPGDVASFRIRFDDDGACDPVELLLRFEVGDGGGFEVAYGDGSTCDVIALGHAEAYFDGPDGPLAGFPSPLGDRLDDALTAVDPFGDRVAST